MSIDLSREASEVFESVGLTPRQLAEQCELAENAIRHCPSLKDWGPSTAEHLGSRVTYLCNLHGATVDTFQKIVAERDQLAERVKELEANLTASYGQHQACEDANKNLASQCKELLEALEGVDEHPQTTPLAWVETLCRAYREALATLDEADIPDPDPDSSREMLAIVERMCGQARAAIVRAKATGGSAA